MAAVESAAVGGELAVLRAVLPSVAVVMPALNEEETVGVVVAAVPRSIPGVGRVEVIVVNDGSSDETRLRARAAGADAICTDVRSRGLLESFKEGLHEALRRGASIVVTLDADGQHDPAFIPDLVKPILAGQADLVLGVRLLAEAGDQMTVMRRQGNRLGSWVAGRALGLALSDATSGYRAFSRDALLRMNILSDYTYTLDTIIDASRKRL